MSPRIGSIFAFAVSLSLTTSVWLAYVQWVWRSIKRKPISVRGLNAAFSAQNSFMALTSMEMASKMKIVYAMAVIAW